MTKQIDPSRLLNWKVPDRVHTLSRRDIAFYALSVACVQDATDIRNLPYVDPGSDCFAALPSMVLVMAYPGFWLGDPDLEIDSRRVVHAEQSVEIFSELPVEGVVTGRTRITDLIDGGQGKAAFLYSERDLFDDVGCHLARVRQTHILRGAGGFGGKGARPQVGKPTFEGAPAHIIDVRTHQNQALLYRLNGDLNPIHSDPVAAMDAGFPRPILHGMCTFGIVTHALVRSLCDHVPARLRSMSLRFTGPVYPGETIRIEIHSNGSFRAHVVERNIVAVDLGWAQIASLNQPVEVEKYAV